MLFYVSDWLGSFIAKNNSIKITQFKRGNSKQLINKYMKNAHH